MSTNINVQQIKQRFGIIGSSPLMEHAIRVAAQVTLRLEPDTLNVWAEMIHPADRDHAFSAFMEYIHSGSREVHEAEYRMRAQDGAWHWMLVKAIAVAWNPEGKSSRVLGLKLDIQEMKNAQKTSLASQDMARALLEQSSRFIGLVSPLLFRCSSDCKLWIV